MPLDGSSTPQSYNRTVSNKSKTSFIIKRPGHLINTCPINIITEHLPQIEEKSPKKPPRKKKEISCSELSSEWLKPGVSLPKLRTRSVTLKRPEAGEPYTVADTVFSNKKSFSSICSPNSPSNVSFKFSPIEEDVIQDSEPNCQHTVGPSKCQFLFNVPSSELVFDNIKIPEEEPEPSHALQLWDTWMKKRKVMQEITRKKLNREPHDFLANQCENHRKVHEDKLMFSYAQIPEAEKWRGHPYYWTTKPKSKKKHENYLFQAETNTKKGVIPDMEFVDIPRVIKIEKGYIREGEEKVESKLLKFWEECPYRRERSEFFKKQRSTLKPNEIYVDELAVVGKQILPTVEVELLESDPKIDIPSICIENENEHSYVDDRKSIACLVIDGKEVRRELGTNYNHSDSKEVKDNYIWQVEFGLNKVKTLIEKTITVENKGTMVIAYSWVAQTIKPKQGLSLNAIKPGLREPWFFFNKNSGYFLPGQIYHLKFYHFARKAGNRTEIWFLKTSPEMFATPESCRIILTAVAEDCSWDTEVNSLRRYLNRRVGESIVRKLLDNIIYDATYPFTNLDYIEYRSFYLEKELFEYHNPKHYYHFNIIMELKEMFDKVSGDNQTEWDLSLSSLVAIVAKTPGKPQHFLMCNISERSRKLFRPNYLALKKGKSHRMVYQILCKMTCFMEEDYKYLVKCLFRKRDEQKRISRQQDYGEGSTIFGEYEEIENTFVECPYHVQAQNLLYFETMFYIKVYQHVCDAVEQIADILETNKFLEPLKGNRVNDLKCL